MKKRIFAWKRQHQASGLAGQGGCPAAPLRLPCISVGNEGGRASDGCPAAKELGRCYVVVDLVHGGSILPPGIGVLEPAAVMVVVCFGLQLQAHVDEGS